MEKKNHTAKTTFLIIVWVSMCVGFIVRLIQLQDEAYQYHSQKAIKNCNVNPEKTLVYDNELRYFKCVN